MSLDIATAAAITVFPPLPVSNEVRRVALLDEIDRLLESGDEVVSVEGEPGVGKSALLSQLLRRHHRRAFCLFTNGDDLRAIDSTVAQFELANQIRWLLTGQELEAPPSVVSERDLNHALYDLQREARRSGTDYILVLDSPDDILDRKDLIQLLPFKRRNLKIVTTIGGRALAEEGIAATVLRTLPFSDEEVAQFLSDLNLSPDEVEAIATISKKIPARLASIRRSILSGIPAGQIAREPHTTIPEIYATEWASIGPLADNEELAIGLIALDRRARTKAQLEQLAGLEEGALLALLDRVASLTISDGLVVFVDPHFKEFVAGRLAHLRNVVRDKVVGDLELRPDELSSLMSLPDHLVAQGRAEQLLEYLNAERYIRLANLSGGLGAPRAKASLALEVAGQVRSLSESYFAALISSTLTAVARSGVGSSELKALLSVGRWDEATRLAQSSQVAEDRLSHLSSITRELSLANLPIDPALLEEIEKCVALVDPDVFRRRAVEVAANLMAVGPDLAMSVVTKIFGKSATRASMDWAMAAMSVAAIGEADAQKTFESKIEDPSVKLFTYRVRSILGDYSADDVLSDLQRVEDKKDRIFLLRMWALNRREGEGVTRVVTTGLEMLAQVPEYVPNARDFREFATAVHLVNDVSEIEDLVSRFDSYRAVALERGPTLEFVRLQLLLARAELTFNNSRAVSRFIDTYYFVSDLPDVPTRVASYSWLISTYPLVNVDGQVEAREGLGQVLDADLEHDFDELLEGSADHHVAARQVVRGLAIRLPRRALSLALRLNTVNRRDDARLEILEAIANAPSAEIDLSAVVDVVEATETRNSFEAALLIVLERVVQATGDSAFDKNIVLRLINQRQRCRTLNTRFLATVNCLRIVLSRTDMPATLATSLRDEVLGKLEAIHDASDRADAAFESVPVIAPVDRELAEKMLVAGQESRSRHAVTDREGTDILRGLLLLAVRSFRALVLRRADNVDQRDLLLSTLSAVAATDLRAVALAELALAFVAAKRTDEGKDIVARELSPLLATLPSEEKARISVVTSTAMYACGVSTALDELDAFDQEDRDHALEHVSRWELYRVTPLDAVDEDGCRPRRTYDDLKAALRIAGRMERDALVYRVLRKVADRGRSAGFYSRATSGHSQPDRGARIS